MISDKNNKVFRGGFRPIQRCVLLKMLFETLQKDIPKLVTSFMSEVFTPIGGLESILKLSVVVCLIFPIIGVDTSLDPNNLVSFHEETAN